MVSDLRRRSMLELPSSGGGEVALYPLMDYGTEVTNGNHIKATFPRGLHNLSDLSKGGVVNNQPVWFVIPAGSTGVLKIKNIKTSYYYAFNFKRANGTASSLWGTGDRNTEDDIEITATPTADESVGCFFVYCSGTCELECDVYFYVDGVRYI